VRSGPARGSAAQVAGDQQGSGRQLAGHDPSPLADAQAVIIIIIIIIVFGPTKLPAPLLVEGVVRPAQLSAGLSPSR
jgi:hypothetical protein